MPQQTGTRLQNAKQIILAANSGELFALVKTDLTLTIDDRVIHSNVFVAKINAGEILLLNFLLANFCTVGMNHRVILLLDKRIPLLVEGYIWITAIKTVCIPLNAEIFTVGQILKNDNDHIPINESLFGRSSFHKDH